MRARQPAWVVLFGAGVAVLSAAAGCETLTGSRSVRLAAVARPYERDIPVPVGFRFVDESSEDRSTGTNRLYLRHVYSGRADKYSVRNFYREHMPPLRWVLVSDGSVKGQYTMRFEKGSEACNVVIRDRSSVFGGTEIQVVISQEARGSRPPAARSIP